MKAVTDDDLAKAALLTALGYDPETHSIQPRMGKTMMGVDILRADGSRAEFFTQKELRAKMDSPAFAKRWADARGEELAANNTEQVAS